MKIKLGANLALLLTMTQVAKATMVVAINPQMSPTPMNRTTARDAGYPSSEVTLVPLSTIYGGVEFHLSDGGAFNPVSLGFTVHRMRFSDVTVDYTNATYSDPASPLYRIYDALGNDITTNGSLLPSITGNKFVVSSLAVNPADLLIPGDVTSIDWWATLDPVAPGPNVTGMATSNYTFVPEPSAVSFVGAGAMMLLGIRRRRQ